MISLLIWGVLIAMPLVGCGYPGLFFTEHTHVGVQIRSSPTENKPLDINLGYDRGIFTVVPRTEKDKDAASVISKTDLEIRFADESTVKNILATGNAAREITKDPERVAALFQICRAPAAFTQRKDNAFQKLTSIKNDKAKVNALYATVVPNGKAKEDERFDILSSRLAGICDPERDLKVLGMYEAL